MDIKANATVIVSKEVAEMAKELESFRGFITQMEKRAAELREGILKELSVGQDGYFDGRKVVAVNARKGSRLDKKAMLEKHAEVAAILEAFTKSTVTSVVETF